MHDDIPLTIGRVTRVLAERILPAVYSQSVPLEVSWNELPGEPIAPPQGIRLDFEPYEVGEPWGVAWSTSWFRLSGTVPAEWRGKTVEAVVDLGFDRNMPGFQCEGLVYRADGSPIKSLNPRNQWIPISTRASGGESVELFIEAAANPVLLDYVPFIPTLQGDILTSSAKRLYTSRRIELAIFESEVFGLTLDLEVLLELQSQLLPAAPRRLQILQALDNALDALDIQNISDTAMAAREALVEVLAAPAEQSAHQISAIGHAHIDSAWLWPVRETIRKVARTASTMTELIDNTDDFLYGMSSAQQYAWLKQHRPEVYERVKSAVAAGRFIPLGGMWVESDTVMPTGESLVRQFSYGQRFFREEFGIECEGVWLPDSFGYSPALPQLMKRAGFSWFFTQKMSWNQVNKFPHHSFLWEGIDGSRVFTHFPPIDTYNSHLSGAELARASNQFRESRVASHSLAPVGWGDGGGGTTREMTGKAERLANLEGSAQVAWQHPNDFFDTAKSELPQPPVWVGELYLELHRATLTSQHKTKQGNRRSEHLLIEAELWATTAAIREGFSYPFDALDDLWRRLLLLQFHDILPGTSIAWVHREAVESFASICREAAEISAAARMALTGVGDRAITFNPTPFARHGVAAFGASETLPAQRPVTAVHNHDGFVLQNEFVTIKVSGQGLIISAIDRATGRQAIARGCEANLLQIHQDFPNQWDAWDIDRFYRNRVEDIRSVDSIELETDDAGAHVTVVRSFGASTIRQVLSLLPRERTLHIDQTVDWHETEKLLKVAFPLAIHAEYTAAETQFGYQKRVTHTNTSWEAAKFETSMHRYLHISEPGFGVALITDSTYGFDTTRDSNEEFGVTTTARLSLLRAPRFPDPATDQGQQTCRYGFMIGAELHDATVAAIALNSRELTVSGERTVEPIVTVAGEGIVVSIIKLADDRSGDLIVRVYESLGRRTTGVVTVTVPFQRARTVTLVEAPLAGVDLDVASGAVSLILTAFEVRTLRFVAPQKREMR